MIITISARGDRKILRKKKKKGKGFSGKRFGSQRNYFIKGTQPNWVKIIDILRCERV